MHPMVKRNPELRKLYEYDNYLADKILGSTGTERSKLIKIRRQVQEKIRGIDMWAPIREEIARRKAEESENAVSE